MCILNFSFFVGDCKTSPCLPAFEQKDALALFNIINPGSSCTIEKIALGSNIIFSAVFGHDDKIQASGLGISEEEAKRDAAENGIRLYVSQVICENLQNIGQVFNYFSSGFVSELLFKNKKNNSFLFL